MREQACSMQWEHCCEIEGKSRVHSGQSTDVDIPCVFVYFLHGLQRPGYVGNKAGTGCVVKYVWWGWSLNLSRTSGFRLNTSTQNASEFKILLSDEFDTWFSGLQACYIWSHSFPDLQHLKCEKWCNAKSKSGAIFLNFPLALSESSESAAHARTHLLFQGTRWPCGFWTVLHPRTHRHSAPPRPAHVFGCAGAFPFWFKRAKSPRVLLPGDWAVFYTLKSAQFT